MSQVNIYQLGTVEYDVCLHNMRHFTEMRDDKTSDEIWLVQHPAVFTQGQAGKAEHILNAKEIAVLQSDRGGQVTYHAPGQIVIYLMLNLHQLNIGIRRLVNTLEKSVIDYLADNNIKAESRCDAPGVYINGAKICSLGLRVKRGCTYHGLAFNVDMDLEPFQRINPCGFSQLAVTQLSEFIAKPSLPQTATALCQYITSNLGYNKVHWKTD